MVFRSRRKNKRGGVKSKDKIVIPPLPLHKLGHPKYAYKKHERLSSILEKINVPASESIPETERSNNIANVSRRNPASVSIHYNPLSEPKQVQHVQPSAVEQQPKQKRSFFSWFRRSRSGQNYPERATPDYISGLINASSNSGNKKPSRGGRIHKTKRKK